MFPVVPWFRAFEVFGPGDPPVPLIVLPFDNVLPVGKLLPPALWAMAESPVQSIASNAIAVNLMVPSCSWPSGIS